MRSRWLVITIAACWTSSDRTTTSPPANLHPERPTERVLCVRPDHLDDEGDVMRECVMVNVRMLRRCYMDVLRRTPGRAGKVTATFTVGGDGNVTASTASGFHRDVDACVAKTIRDLEFPVPRDRRSVPVTLSLQFVAD